MRSHRRQGQIITGHCEGDAPSAAFCCCCCHGLHGGCFWTHGEVSSARDPSRLVRSFGNLATFAHKVTRRHAEKDDWGFWELEHRYAFEPDYLKQLPQLAQVAGVPDPAGVHGHGQQLLQQPAARTLRRVALRPARLLPVPQRGCQHCAIQCQVLRAWFQLVLRCIRLLRLQPLSYPRRHR